MPSHTWLGVRGPIGPSTTPAGSPPWVLRCFSRNGVSRSSKSFAACKSIRVLYSTSWRYESCEREALCRECIHQDCCTFEKCFSTRADHAAKTLARSLPSLPNATSGTTWRQWSLYRFSSLVNDSTHPT